MESSVGGSGSPTELREHITASIDRDPLEPNEHRCEHHTEYTQPKSELCEEYEVGGTDGCISVSSIGATPYTGYQPVSGKADTGELHQRCLQPEETEDSMLHSDIDMANEVNDNSEPILATEIPEGTNPAEMQNCSISKRI